LCEKHPCPIYTWRNWGIQMPNRLSLLPWKCPVPEHLSVQKAAPRPPRLCSPVEGILNQTVFQDRGQFPPVHLFLTPAGSWRDRLYCPVLKLTPESCDYRSAAASGVVRWAGKRGSQGSETKKKNLASKLWLSPFLCPSPTSVFGRVCGALL
jgi:hypothetical protein